MNNTPRPAARDNEPTIEIIQRYLELTQKTYGDFTDTEKEEYKEIICSYNTYFFLKHLFGYYEKLRTELEALQYEYTNKHDLIGYEQTIIGLQQENERLKEVISYLPKVPTEPYEKEMAKQIKTLIEALTELVDIIEGHLEDGDKLDSFTLQPARAVLALLSGDEGVRE